MELDRIKRNVDRMVSQNAPESDIDGYITSEGATVDNVRNFRPNNTAPVSDTPNTGLGKAWQDLKGATNAAVQAAGQGLSFGFADEAQSALAAGIASTQPDIKYKDAYNDAMQIFKQKREQSAKDYPAAYYPAEIAGALATGGAAADNIGGATLAKSFATNPIKTAAGVGALSGGIYGAGTGDGGVEERLKSAGISGGIGALAGPAGSYVASKIPGIVSKLLPTGTEVADNTGRSLQDLVTEAESKSLVAKGDMSSDSTAANKIVDKIKADFPDNYPEVIDAWKSGNQPLAQLYGNRLTTLAKGAAQYPSGKAQADAYFNTEIASAPDRIKDAIKQNVSGVENYHTTVDDLLKAGKAQAAPAYQAAFSGAKGINDPRINEFLQQPELQAGMSKGLKIQRLESVAEGRPFNPQDYAITGFNEAGDPVIGGVPNMRTLDAGKRGLDSMIQEQTDPVTGRVTELGRALIKTKSSYVDELKRVNPDYANALNTAGDYYKVDNALKSGKDFMNTDSEVIGKTLSNMSPQEKTAYKIGVGKQLRDVIDNKYDGSNPYNKIMGSREAQKRLMTILNPTEYQNLESSLKSENRLYKMRNEVLGGSPTASKAIAAGEMGASGQEALSSLATGDVRGLGIGVIKNVVSKAFNGLNDKTADSVSRLLYETDPTQKVLMMEKMMGSKELSDTEKQIVKSAYFKAADLSNTRTQGAVGASTTLSPEQN